MRRREFLGRLAALAPAAAFAREIAAGNRSDGTEGQPVRRILRLATGRVDEVPLEPYVASVLPAEIGNAAPAALEAQAIAARSYAMGRTGRHETEGADLCDGVHCQVFGGRRGATASSWRAAESTAGLVLAQSGRVIAAPFHAVCGGRTARPADVWDDEEQPDLDPVTDDACLRSPGATWSFEIPRAAVPALGARLGLPGARFLEVYGRDADGRVTMVRFAAPGGASTIVRGFDFRREAAGIWGWTSVRSTAFESEETRAAYVLRGRGTGHGAGLCQAGTIVRARRGETRDAILGLYYRGARVATLGELGLA